MDSAQKALIDIATVSKQVVDTLIGYIGRKTSESFLLEKIVVSSGAVLEVLNKASLKDGHVDDRLVAWLRSDEPQACLNTLNQMKEILDRKPEYSVKSFFRGSRSAHTQDNSAEAIRLFQMRKSCFHFLQTAEIWNLESGETQQQSQLTAQRDVLHINQAIPSAKGLPSAAQIKRMVLSGDVQARNTSMLEGKQRVNLEKLNGILAWLNPCNSRNIHERTILLRQPDTCTWLANTQNYKTWRSMDNSFLWLHGKAGAGKTVLAASVIEGLKSTQQDGQALAYFYCDFRDERSTIAAEVMCSLLSQLCQKFRRHPIDPGDLIDDLAEERDEGASPINNIMLLTRYVSRAANQFPQQPFLVIDALDECKDVDVLLGALAELQKRSVRLFVTSRPLQVIKDAFLGLPSIDMETLSYQTSADIKLHVTRELDSHRRLRIMDAKLKDEIYLALCKKSGGMFRWVQCQLHTLKQCLTAVRIREALNDLPHDLDTTYERILAKINEMEEGRVVRRALDWLVSGLCLMRLSQIMESLSIDLDRGVMDHDSAPVHGPALLDALGSLVIYDEVTDIVILSHLSVKEYLTGQPTCTKRPGYHVHQQDAHMRLALLCMCYISVSLKGSQPSGGALHHGVDEPSSSHDDSDMVVSYPIRHRRPSVLSSESHPLFEYVARYGFRHLAHISSRKKTVLSAIEALHATVQNHPSEWEQLCKTSYLTNPPWPAFEHDFVLYILIVFAPESLLCSFLSGIRLQLKDGTNPLIYAATFSKIEHARTLLSKGVSLNRRGWQVYDSCLVLPLEVAVKRASRAMVDLFLAEGSLVPSDLFVRAVVHQKCYIPASIVARLLQTDEFVEWAANVCDEGLLLCALDPMRYARGRPSEQDIDLIQRRLVQIGCDPSARFNETSLRHAVGVGHVSTVRHILSYGIPMPPSILLDASGDMPSSSAMIRFLLNMKCSVDVVSPTGDTPLHLIVHAYGPWATDIEFFKCVQVLADAGCSPLARNQAGETPLHLAAKNGCTSIVAYFLSLSIQLPSDILLSASELPTASTIRLLVNKGADVHVIAANGNTPLHIVLAATLDDREERLECSEILIDAGSNPCLSNATGETSIDIAAKHGHRDVVEYLLSLNLLWSPNILLSVSDSWSSKASSMIKFLISKGANIHVARPNGDTLLHLAIKNHWDIESLKRVQALVNAGCDPRACNLAGETPFHVAAAQGHIQVMEYLLSLGIAVPSDVMLTQFERGSYQTIRLLINEGGDAHTTTRKGNTLLHLAATFQQGRGALETIKLLVDLGCSPTALNSAQETPLRMAARNGRVSNIEYLLSLNVALPADILLAASAAGGQSQTAQTIRYLIDKGADVSVVTADGDTALHLVLTHGNERNCLESVKILADAGCDPRSQNSAGEIPMHAAARSGFTTILEYFLSRDVPLPHNIPLSSSPSTIRFLLVKGVDLRCIATEADMQLMHRVLDYPGASQEDCLECAKILVEAGWDPLLRNSAGETPMHIVVRHRQISTIRYLLSQSVPLPSDVFLHAVVPRDEKHYCAVDRITLVRFLLREGASVNTTNSDGDTPLHLALRDKFILDECEHFYHVRSWKLVEILLGSGSDPSAQNVDGQTPFDIAEANGHFFKENFLRLVRNSSCIRS